MEIFREEYPKSSLPFTFDGTGNKGNNWAITRQGYNPMSNMFGNFCRWVYDKATSEKLPTTFVVSGHSSWLKRFFKAKLAKTGDVPLNLAELLLQGGKGTGYKIKLGNASMIKFELVVGVNGQCSITRGETQLEFGKWQAQTVKDGFFKKFWASRPRVQTTLYPKKPNNANTRTECPALDLGDD